MKNKTELSIVNLSTYTSPVVKEKAGREWVEFGADNNYFQYLIDRYNGSPTNMAIRAQNPDLFDTVLLDMTISENI